MMWSRRRTALSVSFAVKQSRRVGSQRVSARQHASTPTGFKRDCWTMARGLAPAAVRHSLPRNGAPLSIRSKAFATSSMRVAHRVLPWSKSGSGPSCVCKYYFTHRKQLSEGFDSNSPPLS